MRCLITSPKEIASFLTECSSDCVCVENVSGEAEISPGESAPAAERGGHRAAEGNHKAEVEDRTLHLLQ